MGRCPVSETLEVVVVTMVAFAALLILVRSYLPGRDERPKTPGCSNCASNTGAAGRRNTTPASAPTRPPLR
jgi:hypothetical protein